ncbi:MAG: MMPL family transporter, partial [Acidobacteria bacterium]|nr:MMPL family transporter [Acidobacteriota bacterium]
KVANFSSKYPVITLVFVLTTALLALYYAKGISLDDSVQALRSPNNEGLSVTREINSRFGASFTYMMATMEGNSPFEISEKAKKITESLEPLRKDGRILFTDSLSTYLPTQEKQKEIISYVEKLKKEGFTYERIERDFLSACEKNNFDPNYFKDFLYALKKMLNPEMLTYERLCQSPLGGYLEKFMVKKDENKYRGVVYIYISEAYKRSEPNGLISAVKNVCPEAVVTGINRLSRTLRSEMKKSALKAFVIGTIFVLIIIYLDFKSVLLSFLSLSPLFLSIIFLIGTMSILKEPLNMMNIFVTTMIIGIGSDYGIHIVHRFLQPGGKNIERIINETVKPVIIAALTTMAGFGSLYFSAFPGLISIGLVAFLGTFFSMTTCLTFLIAVLELVIRRKK